MNQSSEQNASTGSAAEKQQSMQPQAMLGVEEVRAQWKQKISAAKGKWGKLTEYELLKSEGHQQKLSELVRARYVVSRHDAENQVRRFFNEHEF